MPTRRALASCGGAPLGIIQQYVEQQKTPLERAGYPHPEGRGFTALLLKEAGRKEWRRSMVGRCGIEKKSGCEPCPSARTWQGVMKGARRPLTWVRALCYG